MPSLNKVMLMGNLTRDPETRYTSKNMAVTEIGLAVNRKFKSGDEVKEEVTFVDVTFWGKSGESIAKHCQKGSSLYVEGRLQLDSWDDKQTGKKVYKLKVTGEDFQFIGAKQGEGNSPKDDREDRQPRREPERRESKPSGRGGYQRSQSDDDWNSKEDDIF